MELKQRNQLNALLKRVNSTFSITHGLVDSDWRKHTAFFRKRLVAMASGDFLDFLESSFHPIKNEHKEGIHCL